MESFGIHVARMAGFPNQVISEAKRKAYFLEHQSYLDTSSQSNEESASRGKRCCFLMIFT
jgi:DNA mismatch repair ATPase MutS